MARGVVAAASAAVLLAACAPGAGDRGGGADRLAAWEEPDAYAYTVRSDCGERDLVGTFRVEVEDGQVTGATAEDERAALVRGDLVDLVPTLGELVAEVGRADDADGLVVATTADGRPESIEIDPDADAVDDEACYVITDFVDRSAGS